MSQEAKKAQNVAAVVAPAPIVSDAPNGNDVNDSADRSDRREEYDGQKTQTRSSSLSPRNTDHDLEKHESVEEAVDNEQDDSASIGTAHENELTGEERHDVEKSDTTSSKAPLHSVFSKRRRTFIISMAAAAGFFSPLSANIYFPALNALSRDLHVSSGLINLSLTTYMIFQGLAPTLMGDLADTAGRRPAYIVGFTIYIGANIGLALQNNYAALLVLRCLQSSGSSSTIALASGVASDVATAAERGSYMGWVNGGALIGPAIGPVLGGILAQYLTWRSIFWFLTIIAVLFMIPLILVFPETGRNVVGNGSIPPQRWNRDLLSVWNERQQRKKERPGLQRTESRASARSARQAMAAKRKLRVPNPFHTLKICMEKDVGMLLLYNALVYTSFYMVTATVPYLFEQIYGFNDLQIGLCFLPFGFGCFMAPMINGKVMDLLFRRVAKKIGVQIQKGRTMDTRHFPLEQARVPLAFVLVIIGNTTLVGYGWAVNYNAPLAVNLILLFIMGYTITGSFNCCSVMLVDYYPQSPAMATAGNNLCRCLLGAGGTAAIIPMIEAMGRGWCFTFVAFVIYGTTPILWILLRWGPKWREARLARLDEIKNRQNG